MTANLGPEPPDDDVWDDPESPDDVGDENDDPREDEQP